MQYETNETILQLHSKCIENFQFFLKKYSTTANRTSNWRRHQREYELTLGYFSTRRERLKQTPHYHNTRIRKQCREPARRGGESAIILNILPNNHTQMVHLLDVAIYDETTPTHPPTSTCEIRVNIARRASVHNCRRVRKRHRQDDMTNSPHLNHLVLSLEG